MHEEIRQLRERAGLSPMELAERLGVARSTAYAWEDPKQANRPKPAQLIALLDLAGADNEEQLRLLRRLGEPRVDSDPSPAGEAA